MYRATTAIHTFTLPEQAASYAEIHITYKQGNAQIIKHAENGVLPSGMTFDDKDVIIRLTQDETKTFAPNKAVDVQVRVLTTGGDAYASRIFKVKVNDVLCDEVLS